jgi:class 3 adenylate cyclase
MATTPLKRKLAAILAADAVGYSRLMAGDEEGTMRVLAAHRAVIDGIIEFHEGRIVNTAGDSVLAEFASPVQAVRCAVEIQDALRTRNDSLPENQRLQFRIGVNLGDVMVKGDDLLGDGINVAARLESVADPGGICVSSSVYDQIAGKLDLGFVDIGAKSLKNIDRPVRIYRIDRDGRTQPGAKPRRQRHTGLGKALTAGAMLATVGLGAWYFGLLPVPRGENPEAAKAAADARARIEQELAKAQAEVRAQKRRAETEAAAAAEARRALEEQRAAEAHARADAELAHARAEAEAARLKAATELAAATKAAANKRRIEDEHAAEAHARAEAELARAHAEAEEAKRKAAAELAAAEEARHSAEASAKAAASEPASQVSLAAPPASLREGRWSAAISCPAFERFPERNITVALSFAGDALSVEYGEPDAPLSLSLRGVQDADGSVWLRGKGVSGRLSGARRIPAGFFMKPVADRYEGRGRLGKRECTAVISRSP